MSGTPGAGWLHLQHRIERSWLAWHTKHKPHTVGSGNWQSVHHCKKPHQSERHAMQSWAVVPVERAVLWKAALLVRLVLVSSL